MYTARCKPPPSRSNISLQVGQDDNFPLEGSQIYFSCPTGHILSNSDVTSAICTSDGEWSPDPSQLHCESTYYSITIFVGDCTDVCWRWLVFCYYCHVCKSTLTSQCMTCRWPSHCGFRGHFMHCFHHALNLWDRVCSDFQEKRNTS